MSNSEMRILEIFLLTLPTPETIELQMKLLFLHFFQERCRGRHKVVNLPKAQSSCPQICTFLGVMVAVFKITASLKSYVDSYFASSSPFSAEEWLLWAAFWWLSGKTTCDLFHPYPCRQLLLKFAAGKACSSSLSAVTSYYLSDLVLPWVTLLLQTPLKLWHVLHPYLVLGYQTRNLYHAVT